MNFGEMLYQLKEMGERMTREEWSGQSYIYHVPAGEYNSRTDAAKKEYPDTVPYAEYIAYRDQKGVVQMYQALPEDLFATDWAVF